MKFYKKYALLTLFFLLLEIAIALFVRDRFIRPFVGDVLVVVLLYCFFRSFLKTTYQKVALGVLLFAYTIEILQYFDFVEKLGLQDYKIIAIALGSTFDYLDLLAYTLGFGLIWMVESYFENRKIST